jgi:glyoxylase-like metal-dependent hydrolase (beta-lactamase superfamily II)
MTDASVFEPKLVRIAEHVYWMPAGPPDKPSLCAVVGSQGTLMLEAGASSSHARMFLDALREANIAPPRYVALTHWHWDHVFGAAEVGVPVIAHTLTARELATLSTYEWDDASLDQRVDSGEEIPFCADNIKLELPEPRTVVIRRPEIVFRHGLEIQLGDVTCTFHHVGGDHAADSCVIHIEPDGVLFLGDCLYQAVYAPQQYYTVQRLFPLLDRILAFDAQHYIEGHSDTPLTHAGLEAMAAQMRSAWALASRAGLAEAAALEAIGQSGTPVDEDLESYIKAFVAGRDVL